MWNCHHKNVVGDKLGILDQKILYVQKLSRCTPFLENIR